VLLAGCTTPNRTTGTADPLLGGAGLRPTAEATPPPGNPVAAVPPVPPANSGTSTAALASAGQPQLDRNRVDPDRDLRISSGGNQGNDGWARQEQATVVRGEGSGAVLRSPESAAGGAARPELTPVSLPSNRATSLEQAQHQLDGYGPLWQRLERAGVNDDWKFTCAIPNKQDAKKHHTYVATAHDSLAAVQAVLDQIDRGQ
jgi:hypothetical protein